MAMLMILLQFEFFGIALDVHRCCGLSILVVFSELFKSILGSLSNTTFHRRQLNQKQQQQQHFSVK
jgi:hypothetical protein